MGHCPPPESSLPQSRRENGGLALDERLGGPDPDDFFFPAGPEFVCQMHSSTEQEGCHSILAVYFVTSDTHSTIDDNHKRYSSPQAAGSSGESQAWLMPG